jgi:hypothetical protein
VKAFIVLRDRVTYAQACLTAMIRAGLEPVVVDQGSTWPSAVEWLDVLEASFVPVLRRGGGTPQSLWSWEPFREARGDGRYIVTDPDVVPADYCPRDWPARLSSLLDEYPSYHKAGLGLRTDNLPGHYQRLGHVLSWEHQFWQHPLADGVFDAAIDTTLAVYRGVLEPPADSGSALRTGPPYMADHLAWHENLDNLPPELAWYYAHMEAGIAYWTVPGKSRWGT